MFWTLLIGSISIGCIYGLVGLGYSLIYKASAQMSFAQGEILMLGGFLTLLFYKELELPFVPALLLATCLMFIFGMLLERLIIRRLVNRKADVIFVVLATIGLSYVLQNAAMLIWGSNTKRFPQIFQMSVIKLGSVNVQPESLFGIILAVALMILVHLFMNKTRFGTAMRAASQNPLAAKVMGVNTHKTTSLSWAIACVLTAFAGVIVGPLYGCSYTMGSMIGTKGFIAAVLGGYGNMYGAILGGLIIGLLETMVSGYISSSLKDIVVFIVLIIVLYLKPSGIFNEKVLS